MNEIVKANSGFETASYVISQVEPLARMADLYAKGGLVPTALIGNSAAVFTILTAGVELGIGPATALRAIHIIEGRATLSAGIMVGLAMMAGVAFEYQQQDATACRIKWTRGESSGVVTFTMADAKLAGLADKANWKRYPAAMLTARCQSMAARQSAPDRLAGLYAPEELGAPVTVRESGDVEVIETTTPEPIVPLPQHKVEPAGATTAQKQKVAIMAREMGLTVDLPHPDGKTHTAFEAGNGAEEAAGHLGAGHLFIVDLTKAQAHNLIDWMTDLQAAKAVAAQQDDAAEALGSVTNG